MNHEMFSEPIGEMELQIAKDTLERYSGSPSDEFQPFILLTNFPAYVKYFSESRDIPVSEGSMFKVSHSPSEKITILDFKIGSPAAALVTDLIAHLPIKGVLLLGMCGGLRKHYTVGDYFVPVASIRAEGTSDFYFPPVVPSMANFMMQKSVFNILETEKLTHHIGITWTTNKRFWEFNEHFKDQLRICRPQSIEMECATLFTASYYYKLPLGALLLISDLPMVPDGIKTKKSSTAVLQSHSANHVELGVKIIHHFEKAIEKSPKGVFRGPRKKLEKPS